MTNGPETEPAPRKQLPLLLPDHIEIREIHQIQKVGRQNRIVVVIGGVESAPAIRFLAATFEVVEQIELALPRKLD